jgi:hypothetical protein
MLIQLKNPTSSIKRIPVRISTCGSIHRSEQMQLPRRRKRRRRRRRRKSAWLAHACCAVCQAWCTKKPVMVGPAPPCERFYLLNVYHQSKKTTTTQWQTHSNQAEVLVGWQNQQKT